MRAGTRAFSGRAGLSLTTLAAAAVLLVAPSRAGAVVTIGSNLASLPNVGFTGTQTYSQAALPGRQVSSPIDGVIVRWRLHSTLPGGTARLRVLRPGSAAFSGAGASATATVSGTGSETFPTRLPVRAGDYIGANQLTDFTLDFKDAVTGASVNTWNPALADLETRAADGSLVDHELLLNADVEPDADADGFGDETQDACPGQAGDANGCEKVPPETTLTKAPKKKLKTRRKTKKVKFKFTSSEPGSDFRCEIDNKHGTACHSPYRQSFKPGKHSFEVQAIDAADNADPTPATAKFKLKRKAKRKR